MTSPNTEVEVEMLRHIITAFMSIWGCITEYNTKLIKPTPWSVIPFAKPFLLLPTAPS